MSQAPRPKKKVLVVDDYDDGREMFAEVLQFNGYEVETAKDGREAIEKAQHYLPDAILMDLSLPIIDGYEATRRLKEHAPTRNIPVVALSAHVRPSYSESALTAGCERFIPKPCNLTDLVAAVKSLMPDDDASQP